MTMTPTEVVDLIDQLVAGRISRDHRTVVGLLDGLLRGPRGNSLAVALVLAGTVGDGDELRPGETFHRMRIPAASLPPHIAAFQQMVVALNNRDRAMARDLFLGFVGDDGRRALQILAFGLNQVLHTFRACSCYRPAAEP